MLSDLATYVADPFGRTYGNETFFVWFVSPQLRVIRVWGHLSATIAARVLEATRVELAGDFPAYSSLVDFRGMHMTAPEAYELLLEASRTHGAQWQRVLRGSAVVQDGGMASMAAGAIVGYTQQLGYAITVTIHDAVASAVASLPVDVDARTIEDGIAARQAAVEGDMSFLADVRAWIDAHLVDATAAECARSFGIAPRTLQRRLLGANASFRDELQAQRVARAQRLLATTDLKVSSVATEVGYPKIQNLANALRRATGMSPAAWREAHRR